VNVFRSLDGGEDLVFTRLSYADAEAGMDMFSLWSVTFAGDDQVTGFGATLPQAAADLHRQRRDEAALQAFGPPPGRNG
jgi:hypothetical protein